MPERPEPKSADFWRAKELGEDPHTILKTLVNQIQDDHAGRIQAYQEYDRLLQIDKDEDEGFVLDDDTNENELLNTIETLWAQVFKTPIVPACSVSEADYEEWSRARAYSRWLEGVYDEAEIFAKHFPRAGSHAITHGLGCLRVYWEPDGEDKKVAHIRVAAVHPKNIFVDKQQARSGCDRVTVHVRDYVDRWTLYEKYGCKDAKGYYGTPEERKAAIAAHGSSTDEDVDLHYSNRDMIQVWETWRPPSYPGSKDGCHAIWTSECTLVYEQCEWVPLMFMRFGIAQDFYGDSAVRRLAPLQKKLDRLNSKINESQDVMGVPRILVQRGNVICKQHIDDVPGGILEVENMNGIRDWNAQCVTPELYQERDSLPRKMRSVLGVSDFEVQQTLPPGVRDIGAPFLERMVDQGQARHAMLHKQYEHGSVQVGYLMGRMAEDLQKAGYDVVAQSPGESKSTIQMLSFKEVMIDRKRMKLRVQPMSQLPQTFAGKVKAIKDLKEVLPTLDDRTVARMTEVPDVNGTTDILVSSEEMVMRNLHYIVKKGEALVPLPMDDHMLIAQLGTAFINSYRIREDADDHKVGLLLQYIEEALALSKGLGDESDLPPDPMAPPPGMGGMPMDVPPDMQGMPPPPMGGPPPPGAGPMGDPMLGPPMGPEMLPPQ